MARNRFIYRAIKDRMKSAAKGIRQGWAFSTKPIRVCWRFIGAPDFTELIFMVLFFGAFLGTFYGVFWLTRTELHLQDILPVPVLEPCTADSSTQTHCFGWDDIRSIMFALAGLVGAVFGVYQLKNSATRSRLTRIDTFVRREAERNDRYVKAVELLKDQDDSVRMGGIYALRKLATEDRKEYFETVVKVLSAYIRYRTNMEDKQGHSEYPPQRKAGPKPPHPAAKKTSSHDNQHGSDTTDRDYDTALRRFQEWTKKAKPTEPVKAAIEALNELWKEQQKGAVDLRGTFLVGLEASDFEMRGWNFQDAHLEGADLQDTHLEDANLIGAHLEGADLARAHLEGADLIGAHLEGANLFNARLEDANLSGAHLEVATLMGAHLKGADLARAHLEGANLWDANLERAHLMGANLEGSKLESANLEGSRINGQQLNVAVWPTGATPISFPEGYSADQFDKSWCTDPDNPEFLLPRTRWGSPPEW